MPMIDAQKRFYVYRHIRRDTGMPFYIGKGANRRKRKTKFERAASTHRTNPHWQRIVAKHGHDVEILNCFETEREAIAAEMFFIRLHGRTSDGGTLVNLTDGGDGRARGFFSEDERKARSERLKGKQWPKEFGEKIAAAKRGIATSIQKGDKLPQWWRERISKAVTGERNSRYGKTGEQSKQSRAVIDTATGETIVNVTRAAAQRGMKMKTLYNMLSGHRPNTTTLKFA